MSTIARIAVITDTTCARRTRATTNCAGAARSAMRIGTERTGAPGGAKRIGTARTGTTGAGPTRTGQVRTGPAPTAPGRAVRNHRRPEPAAPNYAVRRVLAAAGVLAAMAAVVALATAVVASPAGFRGVPAVASEATPATNAEVVVARPGDTLWSIAAERRGDVGHRRYLDALIELNGGTSIQAGQAVRLP